MIDQLMVSNKTDVCKEKLCEELFGANRIFPLNSDHDAYGKSDVHSWHIDDLGFIQRWDYSLDFLFSTADIGTL